MNDKASRARARDFYFLCLALALTGGGVYALAMWLIRHAMPTSLLAVPLAIVVFAAGMTGFCFTAIFSVASFKAAAEMGKAADEDSRLVVTGCGIAGAALALWVCLYPFGILRLLLSVLREML